MGNLGGTCVVYGQFLSASAACHSFIAARNADGVAALFLLHYFGHWIGFSPEISLFNFMQAVVLGVPGVVLMTVVHFLL